MLIRDELKRYAKSETDLSRLSPFVLVPNIFMLSFPAASKEGYHQSWCYRRHKSQLRELVLNLPNLHYVATRFLSFLDVHLA